MKKFIKYLAVSVKFINAVITQFRNDGCMTRASALAFTTLLSIVPLMTVSLTILQAFPMFAGLQQKIQDFIFSNFVATAAQVIQDHIQKFTQQALHVSAPGFFFLLLTAILMIFNMERAFNAIWHVKEQRRGIPAFLMYWAVLTLLPIIMGVGFTISAYVKAFFAAAPHFKALDIIFGYVPFLTSFIAFFLLYLTVPNCKVPWRSAVIGGAVASLFFEVAKFGFTWYITHFPSYTLLYGALATIPIFLVWVYWSWLVILFGAVVSHVVAKKSWQSRRDAR